MKILFNITLSILLFISTTFDKGFKEGYKEGYCYQIANCIEPLVPLTPLPTINESADSYKDGYNRGFSMGRAKRVNN
jgi:hypothetical protein